MPEDHPAVGGEPFEEFYERMIGTLRFVSHVRFGVPLADAEGIVHDAFIKFMRDYRVVRDPSSWLVTIVANASRNYLRDNMRELPMPADAETRWPDPRGTREADIIATRLALGATFQKLDSRCNDVLYRFHVRGETTQAIASALGTTAAYIQLRLHLCRKRARAIYLSLTKVRT